MIKILQSEKQETGEYKVKLQTPNDLGEIQEIEVSLPEEEHTYLTWLNGLVENNIVSEEFGEEIFKNVEILKEFYFNLGQLTFRHMMMAEMAQAQQNTIQTENGPMRKTDSGIYMP